MAQKLGAHLSIWLSSSDRSQNLIYMYVLSIFLDAQIYYTTQILMRTPFEQLNPDTILSVETYSVSIE